MEGGWQVGRRGDGRKKSDTEEVVVERWWRRMRMRVRVRVRVKEREAPSLLIFTRLDASGRVKWNVRFSASASASTCLRDWIT